MELIGPYLVGCVLLALAGAMKAMRPDDTARALAPFVPARLRGSLQFRQLRMAIRFGSCLEAGLGLIAIVLPRPSVAALVGASYVVFALVVASVRFRGGALASCGCFGTPDTPATYLHVVLNVVFALASVSVAVSVPSAGLIFNVLGHEPLHGMPLVLAAGVASWLTYLALSVLSALQAARRPVVASAPRA